MSHPQDDDTVSMIPPAAFRRRDALGLIGLAFGATLGVPAFAQPAPKKGGVLKVAYPANPSSLDPCTGGAAGRNRTCRTNPLRSAKSNRDKCRI